jgi:Na+-transporting NADH:ubiquinone oxidoreductase subunit NqrB
MVFSLGHWLLFLLASQIVLGFLIKGITGHHASNPAAAGLAAVYHA